MRTTCFPASSSLLFYLWLKVKGERGDCTRVFPASDIRCANAQWAHGTRIAGDQSTSRLLHSSSFRIETQSGNIFSRANLIKARRVGFLNEQTAAGANATTTTGRSRWRRRGRWRRDASKCNFMPQFFSFRSCRAAKVSSTLEDRLIFSSWFCIFPRGNKLGDQASATRELRINVFDVQYYRLVDDCDSYRITEKYRTFYKKNFSLSLEY